MIVSFRIIRGSNMTSRVEEPVKVGVVAWDAHYAVWLFPRSCVRIAIHTFFEKISTILSCFPWLYNVRSGCLQKFSACFYEGMTVCSPAKNTNRPPRHVWILVACAFRPGRWISVRTKIPMFGSCLYAGSVCGPVGCSRARSWHVQEPPPIDTSNLKDEK